MKNWCEELAKEMEEICKNSMNECPYIMLHEFRRLIELLGKSEVYGTMLQIKDFAEVLLKFPLLIISSRIYKKHDRDKRETDFLKALLNKLSLGDWERLARKIVVNDYPETRLLKLALKAFDTELKVGGNKFKIIKWRNTTIGHGALRMKTDSLLINEIRCISLHLAKSFNKMAGELGKIKLFLRGEGGERELNDDSICKDIINGKVLMERDGEKLCLYPYVLLINGSIYFYDSLLHGKYKKTSLLSYLSGYSLQTVLDALNDLYTDLNIHHNRENTSVISNDLMEIYLSATKPDKYERPEFIADWLKQQLEENDKGVFLLRMDRGTGKSAFSRALDGLRTIDGSFTKEDFLRDFRCRAYYIENSIFHELRHFLSGLYNVLTFNPDNSYIQHGILGVSPSASNPAEEMAGFLKNVRNAAYDNYNEEKLILVIDGLDEIPAEAVKDDKKPNLFDFIPTSDMLEDGIYILLTARREDDIEEEKVRRHINEVAKKVNSCFDIGRDLNDYQKILCSYIRKRLQKESKEIEEKILDLADNRFLYVRLVCTIMQKGGDLAETEGRLVDVLLDRLEKDGGRKYSNKARRILSVLSFFNEPLSTDELSGLCGSVISLSFLALLHDLDGVLRKERTFRGTLYALAHDDMRMMIHKSCKNVIKQLKSEWLEKIFRMTYQQASDADDIEALILSKVVDIIKADGRHIDAQLAEFIFQIVYSFARDNKDMNLNQLRRILSAYNQVLLLENVLSKDSIEATYYELGSLLLTLGHYSQAEYILTKACNVITSRYATYSEKNLKILDLTARLYFRKGDYPKSEKLYKEVINAKENFYGADHIETARSKFKYAIMGHEFLIENGIDIAEKTYKEVLEVQKNLLGPLNSETTWTMNNMADIFWIKGNIVKAKELFYEALQFRIKALGQLHPDVAWTMNLLAGVYYAEGQLEQAKSISEKALDIRKNTIGYDHPDYAWSLTDYSTILMGNKQYSEAEETLRQAIEIYEEKMGEEHPYSATALNNLGILKYITNELDIAENIFKKVLRIKEKHLNSFHPFTANTYNNYGCLFFYNRDFSSARQYLDKGLKIIISLLGEESIDAAIIKNNLAALMLAMNNEDEAFSYLNDVEKTARNQKSINTICLYKLYKGLRKMKRITDNCPLSLSLNLKTIDDNSDYPVTSYNNHTEIIHVLDFD